MKLRLKQHAVTTLDPNKTQKGEWIKARILLPFSLVILSVIAAFVVTAYLQENGNHERALTEKVVAVERLFRQQLEQDSALMLAAQTAFSHDDGLKKVFLAGDRKALLKRAWPIFDELRKHNSVTHLYFTLPDRVNFLRVHQPDRHGDRIDRISTLRAAAAKVAAQGIELGPLGTFTLRVVSPWYDGNRLIGYLELGKEIDHITEEVHRILGVDLLVLVYKNFLDPQLWKEGREMLGHQKDWDRYGSTLVVGRAMDKIPKTLTDILGQDEHIYESVLQFYEDGQNQYAAFLPLTDISGREVGDFIVVQDVTAIRADFRNSLIMTGILCVVVGGFVFAIFYVILSRVQRDYHRQREIELQLSRVNKEHQKVVQVEKLSAMGLMIGEIAHQLNNPLAGVVNMAQLAEREVDDPNRTKELLGAIRNAGKDCHAFVKRMLQFGKISSFHCEPTDLNRLIEDTIALFQQSFGNRAKIVAKLPENPPTLVIDPVLVRHAVFNLLTNAAQASSADGTITIHLSEEILQEEVAGWTLAIRDQGPGVPDNILDKIFTPFFTTRAEGTGLGLPVVQHVAILHEGNISVANLAEGGAVFSLWLPNTQHVT